MSTDEPWSDLPTKTTPVLTDILAILDSEDSDPNTKNKIITISSIPGLTSGSLNDLTDVTITSQKLGDLLYADSTTSWANLNPGVDGQILTLAGGVPGWSDNIDITQTPWLQDIDAATFGVFDFGYLIGQNSEVDHTIALPSAFVPIWLGNGEGIAWDTNGGSGAGSDFVILSTDSGDTIEITIENVDEYNFGATEADWNGNNLVNAILQSSVTGNSGITGLGIQLQNLDMGGNTITTTGGNDIFINAPTSQTVSLQINSVLEYDFGGNSADWNGNNIFDVNILSLEPSMDTISAKIYKDGNTDLFFNNAISQNIILGFSETAKYTFSNTQADFGSVNLLNALHDHQDAAGGSVLVATAALTATGTKDSTTFLRGDDTWGVPPGASLPVDDTTAIVQDPADNTKLLRFDVGANTTAITGVIATAFTTAKTITIPDATDTLVGLATTDTLTNKTLTTPAIGDFTNATHDHQDAAGGSVLVATAALTATGTKDSTTFLRGDDTWGIPPGTSLPVDDTTSIVQDPADNTKLLRFDVGANSTGITGVVATEFTTAKTITIPDATDTLVGLATTDTLTNKTIDADNNTITNLVIGAEVTGASTALSDTADIAYLNTANTWTTGLQNFSAATFRIPVSATPTVTVDGDIAYDDTVTDFTTGLIRFFGVEEQGLVTMPIAQFTTPTDGFVIAYNATNDEFELVATGATNIIIENDSNVTVTDSTPNVTVTLNGTLEYTFTNSSLNLGGNSLLFGSSSFIGAGDVAIHQDGGGEMEFNVASGNFYEFNFQGINEYTFSATIFDVVGNDIDNIQNLIHDLSTTTDAIDFAGDQLQEISISANTTFTGTNYAIGKSKTIKITTDGTLRTLTFPAGWIFVGSKPADQAASKIGILTLTCFTAAEAGVVAAYTVEA